MKNIFFLFQEGRNFYQRSFIDTSEVLCIRMVCTFSLSLKAGKAFFSKVLEL